MTSFSQKHLTKFCGQNFTQKPDAREDQKPTICCCFTITLNANQRVYPVNEQSAPLCIIDFKENVVIVFVLLSSATAHILKTSRRYCTEIAILIFS